MLASARPGPPEKDVGYRTARTTVGLRDLGGSGRNARRGSWLIGSFRRGPSLQLFVRRFAIDLLLVVAGDGPSYHELKERATGNVEFLGHVDDADLVPLMQRCAASVFPSVDDFGLIPVETMACGRPVLAFAGGGALETVKAGETGEFFDQPTVDALRTAVERFDPDAYDSAAIRAHAERWHLPRFQEAILRTIQAVA